MARAAALSCPKLMLAGLFAATDFGGRSDATSSVRWESRVRAGPCAYAAAHMGFASRKATRDLCCVQHAASSTGDSAISLSATFRPVPSVSTPCSSCARCSPRRASCRSPAAASTCRSPPARGNRHLADHLDPLVSLRTARQRRDASLVGRLSSTAACSDVGSPQPLPETGCCSISSAHSASVGSMDVLGEAELVLGDRRDLG